ncbi:MAG: hypothetical protein LBK60_02060 [Verrucomicrobiales bacterium]|jgi:type II secretory pathway pseudopilin PulG|nr:hypothetical protein [Verrucomicrobiales bacterium]
MTTKRLRSRGFTLVEVFLSLGVLTTAAAGLLAALPVALKNGADAARTGTAGMIAESLLADFSAFGKLRLAADADTTEFLALDDDGKILRAVGADIFAVGDATASFLASLRREPARSSLFALTVTVEWPAAAPASHRQRRHFGTLLPPCP